MSDYEHYGVGVRVRYRWAGGEHQGVVIGRGTGGRSVEVTDEADPLVVSHDIYESDIVAMLPPVAEELAALRALLRETIEPLEIGHSRLDGEGLLDRKDSAEWLGLIERVKGAVG